MSPAKCFAIASIVPALVVAAAPAKACRGEHSETGFVHQSLPDNPKAVVAAQVEITAMRPKDGGWGESEGRIIKMIRGDYSGSRIIVRTDLTSCDHLPWPGEKGIVAGEVIASTNEALIILPVRTLSQIQIDLRTRRDPSK